MNLSFGLLLLWKAELDCNKSSRAISFGMIPEPPVSRVTVFKGRFYSLYLAKSYLKDENVPREVRGTFEAWDWTCFTINLNDL